MDLSLSYPEDVLMLLEALVSGERDPDTVAVGGCELVAADLPPREMLELGTDVGAGLFFLRRSPVLELLPRRIRSKRSRIGRSSKSGVGVVLRDEFLE